jgi:hypothetical protein
VIRESPILNVFILYPVQSGVNVGLGPVAGWSIAYCNPDGVVWRFVGMANVSAPFFGLRG